MFGMSVDDVSWILMMFDDLCCVFLHLLMLQRQVQFSISIKYNLELVPITIEF
jgi:hypothetical protein